MTINSGNISPLGESSCTGATVVDMHCHIQVPEVEKLVSSYPEFLERRKSGGRLLGKESVTAGKEMIASVLPKLTDPSKRIEDMDRMGVDIQAISPSPAQYHYWAEQDLSEEIVRLQNERLAEIQSSCSARFACLGTVSLQHPKLAVEQLIHLTKVLGLRGVQISTDVEGAELADEKFEGFWKRAEELDILVIIHPFGCNMGGERLASYYLQNVIGQPLETTIALSHLIFSGMLDRHPKAKILAVHGGGYLPSYIGRTNHAFAIRPECKCPKHPPNYYLQKLYFDTLVYTDGGLKHLIDEVGAKQMVMGTDYPYDMGCDDPVGHVKRVTGLSGREIESILGTTAVHLLNLEIPVGCKK